MKRYYPGLDLVRFAAAWSVMSYHLGFLEWNRATDPVGRVFRIGLSPAAASMSSGWVGVPVFFMLSGFVIALSAHGRTVRAFAVSRALRLYPCVWLCVPLTAIAIAPDPLLASKIMRSITLWPIGPWVSGVYWTLAVEIAFYLLVAAVMAFKRSDALDLAGMTFAIIGSAYWLIRLVDFATGGHAKAVFAWWEGPHGSLVPVTSAEHFGFGLLLWSVVQNGTSRFRIGLIALCMLAGVISTASSARYNLGLHGEPSYRIVIAPALYMLGAVSIAACVLFNDRLTRHLAPFASMTRIVGLLTYPLYLVHSEAGARIMRTAVGLGACSALLIAVGTVLVMAGLVLWLERYLRRWLGSLIAPRTRTPIAAMSSG